MTAPAGPQTGIQRVKFIGSFLGLQDLADHHGTILAHYANRANQRVGVLQGSAIRRCLTTSQRAILPTFSVTSKPTARISGGEFCGGLLLLEGDLGMGVDVLVERIELDIRSRRMSRSIASGLRRRAPHAPTAQPCCPRQMRRAGALQTAKSDLSPSFFTHPEYRKAQADVAFGSRGEVAAVGDARSDFVKGFGCRPVGVI